MSEKVTLFVAEHCVPCKPIKDAIMDGSFLINGKEGGSVDMIDIETDDGFTEMLSRELAAVPSAYIGSKECKISIDEEMGVVMLDCDGGTDNGDDKE